jgi:hypothetical protein
MAWPITLKPHGGGIGVRYAEDEAQWALAGYAFGTTDLNWTARALSLGSDLAAPPMATTRHAWAYFTFDCVPTDPHRIGPGDIAITASLDSHVGGVAILGLAAIAEELSTILARIPAETKFWELPVTELDRDPPPHGTVSWQVWRAWALLMGLPQVERATTHKLLHRKRPQLFPMLDSITSPHLGRRQAWATIHRDLTCHAASSPSSRSGSQTSRRLTAASRSPGCASTTSCYGPSSTMTGR